MRSTATIPRRSVVPERERSESEMLRFWHFDLEALTAEQMAAEVYELSR